MVDVEFEKRGRGKVTCFHCGQTGHTQRTCWKLHGKPPIRFVTIVCNSDVSGRTQLPSESSGKTIRLIDFSFINSLSIGPSVSFQFEDVLA